jgi:hypothetical protein
MCCGSGRYCSCCYHFRDGHDRDHVWRFEVVSFGFLPHLSIRRFDPKNRTPVICLIRLRSRHWPLKKALPFQQEKRWHDLERRSSCCELALPYPRGCANIKQNIDTVKF